MKKFALISLLAFCGAAFAGPITVAYSESTSGYNLAGSFSGTDLNSDGWLTLGELDAWNINYSPAATLADLNSIGAFDYVNNVWLPNGLQWNQTTPDAFMTWYGWSHSVSTSNMGWAFSTSVDSTAVPEPTSLALVGIALCGIAAVRRKRA